MRYRKRSKCRRLGRKILVVVNGLLTAMRVFRSIKDEIRHGGRLLSGMRAKIRNGRWVGMVTSMLILCIISEAEFVRQDTAEEPERCVPACNHVPTQEDRDYNQLRQIYLERRKIDSGHRKYCGAARISGRAGDKRSDKAIPLS
jgi:hypothetical protein